MKTILFFNNKGGVGKTTLACNIVSHLNIEMDKRVLLIDADPQCNSTQAILSEKLCEDIYLQGKTEYKTLYDIVQPLEHGEPSINTKIEPIMASKNRYQTDLIPGHPKMSIIEDRLSEGWSKVKAREIGGFRITNWAYLMSQHFNQRYDYVVFDVGPSLGALNRSILLASDYVVTPFGCDIFSLLGIRNIADWIKNWKEDYDHAFASGNEGFKEAVKEYGLIESTESRFKFAGYSVQQYIQRKFKEGPRPVKSYDQIMSQIPDVVHESMQFLYPDGEDQKTLDLGHIPYIYSLIPLSQAAKAPITQLTSSDGLVGSQNKQKNEYHELLTNLCKKLLKNLGDSDD